MFETDSFIYTAVSTFSDTFFQLIKVLNFLFPHFDENFRADVDIWVCANLVIGHKEIFDGFIELLDTHIDATSFAIILLFSFIFLSFRGDITLRSVADRQWMQESKIVSCED